MFLNAYSRFFLLKLLISERKKISGYKVSVTDVLRVPSKRKKALS
jgi:hypothetical protein